MNLWRPVCHPKNSDQILIFVNLYQHARNQFIPSAHSSDTVNLWVLLPDWPHPFSIKLTRKTFNRLLICVKLCQHAKNQLIPFVHSWVTVIFSAQRPDWPHPFLTTTNPKIFNSLLIFVNLHQHAKNEADSSICSGELILKTHPSDWLRAFWPVSREQDFSQT